MIIAGFIRVIKKIKTFVGPAELQSNFKKNAKKNRKKEKEQDLDYVEQIKHITNLGPGLFFGELSLIEHKPRGATIICNTDCFFLTLNKDNFTRILATKAKR